MILSSEKQELLLTESKFSAMQIQSESLINLQIRKSNSDDSSKNTKVINFKKNEFVENQGSFKNIIKFEIGNESDMLDFDFKFSENRFDTNFGLVGSLFSFDGKFNEFELNSNTYSIYANQSSL